MIILFFFLFFCFIFIFLNMDSNCTCTGVRCYLIVPLKHIIVFNMQCRNHLKVLIVWIWCRNGSRDGRLDGWMWRGEESWACTVCWCMHRWCCFTTYLGHVWEVNLPIIHRIHVHHSTQCNGLDDRSLSLQCSPIYFKGMMSFITTIYVDMYFKGLLTFIASLFSYLLSVWCFRARIGISLFS